MLIVLVSVAAVALAFPWALKTIDETMDMVEMSFIKSQFDTCSDRILETARTGTNNKCFFNINRGTLTGKTEGLSYTITSSAGICDAHVMTEIDARRHIWQRCNVSNDLTTYEMMWTFPSELTVNGTGISGVKMQGDNLLGGIDFLNTINFRTLTVYVVFDHNPGESGTIVDMARTAITDKNVTLRVRFS
ncbi:MAG: hypothetical protein V1818_00015 [Candidatus Aenigmatarchaeota archaeon]